MTIIKQNLLRGEKITNVLRILKINRSTYYKWRHFKPSAYELSTQHLKQVIKTLHADIPIYGAPRLTMWLQKLGYGISQRRVWRIMHNLSIKAAVGHVNQKPRTKVIYPQRPNLVKNHPERPYRSADITYIQLVDGRWVYLSSVYDPIKRRVVGFAVDKRMTKELVNRSFGRALSCTGRPQYLHSDMGSQYTSDLFESSLRRHQMQHSYSLKGYPYDNAGIESFHATIKRELIYLNQYQTLREVIISVENYIYWFNTSRISLVG